MIPEEFTPKIFTLLKKGISLEQIKKDVFAGIIVGIVALPLAIAFAIASGVSPEKGLITAVLAGFIISFLGGSRVQVGGPTGAFIVIVYGIVEKYGVNGLTIATLMAGIIIIAMGLLRFGVLLQYIPYPLIVGFTSGIAVIIFSSQIRDFCGMSIEKVPSEFHEKWMVYAQHISSVNFYALFFSAGTVAIILFMRNLKNNVIPGPLVAIVFFTILNQIFLFPIETIETKFGEIPNTIPSPEISMISFDTFKQLLPPAFTIALLGSIESLLCAMIADGMIGGKHRSNMELVAQGVANIVSSIFGGIPATGAVARTVTNIKNGGRTPIAGIVHAIMLLIIMIAIGSYAKLVPMSVLAGVLVIVAYNMSEWKNFISVWKGNIYDRLVLVAVFLLTVGIDLIMGIEVGLLLSAILFIKRMGDSTQVHTHEEKEDILAENLPKGMMMFQFRGVLFFGAGNSFQNALERTNQKLKIVVLNFKNVPFIDATGIYRLSEIIHLFHLQGTMIYITEYSPEFRLEIKKEAFVEIVHFHPQMKFCIEDAKKKLQTM